MAGPRDKAGKNQDEPRTALVVQRGELPEAFRTERRQGVSEPARPHPLPPHFLDLNVIWSQLRGNWSWLVVISAEPDYSPSDLGHALTQTGARLSARPVEFFEATNVDLDSSSRLIWHLGTSVSPAWRGPSEEQSASASTAWTAPARRTIVALESPLANPLALPVALAADGVVLLVRRGRTQIDSVRATIEAIGGARILACVMLD